MPLYPPGGGGGGIDASVGGNTSGALALISSGTMLLAGGNNVTLSQNGNAVTIQGATAGGVPIATAVKSVLSANSIGTVTRYAGEDHGHAGVYAAGVSNVGNTSGNTTVQPGQLVLAGGNNVTLSVATAAGGLQTVSISAANETLTVPAIGTSVNAVASASSIGTVTRFAPEDHRHAGLNSISIGGNTSGDLTAGAGSLILAGGANITLSGATAAGGMTVSISGAAAGTAAGAFGGGVSSGGNTAGTTGTVASQLVLVGGSNISLSQSVNGASATVTVNQSNPANLMFVLPTDQQLSTTRDLSASMSTIFLMPITVPSEMTINKIAMLNTMATTISSGTSNTSYGLTISRGVALYSWNSAQGSLSLFTSSSVTPNFSYTSNVSGASLNGIRLHTMPLPATIAPGNWWIAWSFSSAAARTNSTGGTAATTVANSYYYGANFLEYALSGVWSSANDTNWRFQPYKGYYSAQSAAFPAAIASGDILTSASLNLWFRLEGAITG